MYSWYVAVNGQTIGPFSHEQMIAGIRSGQYQQTSMVWREGLSDWLPVQQVKELVDPGSAAGYAPPPMTGRQAH